MAIDFQSINSKLEKLAEVNKYLNEYRKIPQEDFLIDFTVNAAAMHYMVQGIEIIMDIGNHLLGEVYQVKADEYKEIIELLGEYDIIPEDFAKQNVEMAKFRNLVVHDYGDINMKQVYQSLQDAPDTFKRFAEYFSKFLEEKDN